MWCSFSSMPLSYVTSEFFRKKGCQFRENLRLSGDKFDKLDCPFGPYQNLYYPYSNPQKIPAPPARLHWPFRAGSALDQHNTPRSQRSKIVLKMSMQYTVLKTLRTFMCINVYIYIGFSKGNRHICQVRKVDSTNIYTYIYKDRKGASGRTSAVKFQHQGALDNMLCRNWATPWHGRTSLAKSATTRCFSIAWSQYTFRLIMRPGFEISPARFSVQQGGVNNFWQTKLF